MTFLVDKVNEAAAWAALSEDNVSWRIALRATLADGTHRRLVRDSVAQTVGGEDYSAVPFVDFSDFASGQGEAADVLTIRLTAAPMVEAGLRDDTANAIISDLVGTELRDRPIQVSYIVLDVNTAQPIGLIPVFIGFVDSGKMFLEDGGRVYELRVGSYRAYAQKRPVWVYSNVDHRQLFPNDGFFKHHADAVNRSRQIPWNTTSGGSTSSRTGGSGRRDTDIPFDSPFGPSIRI